MTGQTTGPEPAQEGGGGPPTAAVDTPPVPDSLDAAEDDADAAQDDADAWSDYDPNVAAAKARREARSLRQRLRDTEAMRDELVGQVEEAHRAREEAEQAADTARQRLLTAEQRRVEQLGEQLGLVAGGDVWRDGRQLGDYLDDDGQLDPVKVSDAVRKVQSDAPHLVRPTSTLHRHVNPDMSAAQLLAHGVQPALDAPAEQWDQWRVARARLARGGATVAGQQPPPTPTWSDVLRAAVPDTDR